MLPSARGFAHARDWARRAARPRAALSALILVLAIAAAASSRAEQSLGSAGQPASAAAGAATPAGPAGPGGEAGAPAAAPTPGSEPAAKAPPPTGGWKNAQLDLKRPILVALVLLSVLVFLLIKRARRDPNLYLRPLAGIKAIEEAVGRATEMGRPVIYIPGVDDINSIQTIYSMVILGKVAEMVAKYGTPLLVPTCSAFVTPMAEETVKQGYLNAGVPDAYNPKNIRYMSNEQFAFTAATNGMILRERPAASLLMGSFYAESLLMAETGFRAGSIQVAGTANIHQLPFFVVACDYTLIGEEFYAATAYLSRDPSLLGTIKAQDYFKVVVLGYLAAGTILATLASNFGLGASWNVLSGWLAF